MRKRTIALLLALGMLTLLCACGRECDPVAFLNGFRDGYGIEGVLYSPTIPEGEVGYVDEPFYTRLFGADAPRPMRFAILLSPSLTEWYECGIFVCADGYDAIAVGEMCMDRLALVRSIADMTGAASGQRSCVRRYDTVVVYGFLRDIARAERIWKRLL